MINLAIDSLILLGGIVTLITVIAITLFFINTKSKKSNDFSIVYPTMKGNYNSLDLSILDNINKEREFNKLGKLTLDDVLSLTIGKHIDMCRLVEKISHQDIESRFTELKEKLPVRRLGEIVVYGHKDTKSLVEKLLASSSHKEIILGDYNKIGISAKLDFHNKMYVGLILMK